MAKLVKKSSPPEPDFIPKTRKIAALAAEIKAIDIRAYDIRGLTLIADSFVICSASSEPQLKAIFNSVKEGMKEVGVAPLHSEGRARGGWLVIDYGNVIFHLFREEARTFYDLDGLWADAPPIKLELD